MYLSNETGNHSILSISSARFTNTRYGDCLLAGYRIQNLVSAMRLVSSTTIDDLLTRPLVVLHQSSADFLDLSTQFLQHTHHLGCVDRTKTLCRRHGSGRGGLCSSHRRWSIHTLSWPNTSQRSWGGVDPHTRVLRRGTRLLRRSFGGLRQQGRRDVNLACLLQRMLLVGGGRVCWLGLALLLLLLLARGGCAGRAAEGVEAKGSALGSGAAQGELLPALVQPNSADQGRVGCLEQQDADLLGGRVRHDEDEWLEEDDRDEVLRLLSVCVFCTNGAPLDRA